MPIVTILHPTYNNSIRDAQTLPTFFSTSPTELSLQTFRVLAPSQPRLGYHKQGESIYFQILFFKKQIWQFLWYFPHSQVPLLLPQWDDLSRQLHEEDFQLHQRNSNVRKPWKTKTTFSFETGSTSMAPMNRGRKRRGRFVSIFGILIFSISFPRCTRCWTSGA